MPMTAGRSPKRELLGFKERFLHRRKLLSDPEDALEVAQRARSMLALGQTEQLRQFLGELYPADLADVMRHLHAAEERALFDLLDTHEAAEVLDVVDERGALKGVLDLRRLLTARPETRMREIRNPGVVFVYPDTDQEQVANVFARYDLMAMPVVEPPPSYRLLGVITADDIIDVIQ